MTPGEFASVVTFSAFVNSDMRHSQLPVSSCHPFKTGIPVGLIIMTASSLKSTDYLASQIGPIPTRFSWNPLMTCPLMGKSKGSSDNKANSHVVVDVIGGPAAVPTRMGSALLMSSKWLDDRIEV